MKWKEFGINLPVNDGYFSAIKKNGFEQDETPQQN